MTHSINRAREFHSAFGHPIAPAATPGDRKLRELRVKLIAEELTELCQALGVDLTLEVAHSRAKYRTDEKQAAVRFEVNAVLEDDEVNLVEAADALGDLDYVVQGANLVFGFPAEPVLTEIHRANMSKLGADGLPVYREDGKVMKGPNYTPPDVAAVLAAHDIG
ncbi:MAG: hypothetical protein RBT55_03555 [Rhodocyclaceae bacterium]|jgi:predicted HAD superfamily Cof-like phosphohydrolase|nr:hypothetical protein [Rhodocyclaceae bacterium]